MLVLCMFGRRDILLLLPLLLPDRREDTVYGLHTGFGRELMDERRSSANVVRARASNYEMLLGFEKRQQRMKESKRSIDDSGR